MKKGIKEMNEKSVLFDKKGRIAVITINRPEALNAINSDVWQAIGNALEDYAEDPNLWCAIITGAGDRSFCAGADLKALSKGDQIIPTGGEKWGFAGIARHYIKKPIIAAVNGFALGGGTEIALACDLIVASENATFGLPEVKRGLVASGGGLLRLPRQIPMKVAMECILTGEPLKAADAKKWGMVNRVVPHHKLMEEALHLAGKIIENSPLAVSVSKDIAYRSLDVFLDHPSEAWLINEEVSAQLKTSEDKMEGLKAFVEKRKPRWTGN